MKIRSIPKLIMVSFVILVGQPSLAAGSVARAWNETLLEAIRLSFPDPPVHARNLFHVSVAMYDAWAAFDPVEVGYLHREEGSAPDGDVEAAQREAISYAALRVLKFRYRVVPHPNTLLLDSLISDGNFESLMRDLGYDVNFTSTVGNSPAAVGNRVAATVLAWARGDNSNELWGYTDSAYQSANAPLDLDLPGTVMVAPNRWQPLEFLTAFSQTGQPLDILIQEFIGSHWREVWPFALTREGPSDPYLDPGPPPLLGQSRAFQEGNVEVIRYSSVLDPESAPVIDISPGSLGNNSLGSNDGAGHALNPAVGLPYAENWVNEADFGRVVAEYWADGPESETPPGHWNVIANWVVDHSSFRRRWMGEGPELGELEWDVKMYFLINAALHDAAVACWTCKREYDYVRPISSIRHLAGLGQSSDPDGPSYHPDGLPLVPDLIEVVTVESVGPGGHHAHLGVEALGKIALWSWQGEPDLPSSQIGGVGWILAENWFPYQRATFVTPAFAGYVSGHSTFSRAAAEVLTLLTGSKFFPGGLREHYVPAGGLEFEAGPAEPVVLQWATYYDAADQAGLSRLYGGIHVPADDGPGRVMGSECGKGAWDLGPRYFDGSILAEAPPVQIGMESGAVNLEWRQRRGLFYRLEEWVPGNGFVEIGPFSRAEGDRGALVLPVSEDAPRVFRVRQSGTGQ